MNLATIRLYAGEAIIERQNGAPPDPKLRPSRDWPPRGGGRTTADERRRAEAAPGFRGGRLLAVNHSLDRGKLGSGREGGGRLHRLAARRDSHRRASVAVPSRLRRRGGWRIAIRLSRQRGSAERY
jgi:hypothetical protein